MDTDRLIGALAADVVQDSTVGAKLALALPIGLAISAAAFFAVLGARPDIRVAMHNPFFVLKFVVAASLAVIAIVVSLNYSRPNVRPVCGWLLLLPVALLVAAIAAEASMPQRVPAMTRLVGSNSRVCLTAIPLLSVPIMAACFIGLRHGASAYPGLAGACAGLISAGFAAMLYAAHCPDDSPLFVATWYSTAAIVVAAAGFFAGTRLLRI